MPDSVCRAQVVFCVRLPILSPKPLGGDLSGYSLRAPICLSEALPKLAHHATSAFNEGGHYTIANFGISPRYLDDLGPAPFDLKPAIV